MYQNTSFTFKYFENQILIKPNPLQKRNERYKPLKRSRYSNSSTRHYRNLNMCCFYSFSLLLLSPQFQERPVWVSLLCQQSKKRFRRLKKYKCWNWETQITAMWKIMIISHCWKIHHLELFNILICSVKMQLIHITYCRLCLCVLSSTIIFIFLYFLSTTTKPLRNAPDWSPERKNKFEYKSKCVCTIFHRRQYQNLAFYQIFRKNLPLTLASPS